MPEGWSFNPWALSPWALSPDGDNPARDAARDTARMGGIPSPSLVDVLQPPVPVKNPDDYDPADWYAYFAEDWPIIPNVIPLNEQVLEKDRETVKSWVNSRLSKDKQRNSIQCFHFAKYQMDQKKFSISGPPALDGDSILIIREYRHGRGDPVPEIHLREAIRAVSYIRSSLVAGTPVMIGVKIKGYEPEPNNIYETPYIIATDHFIVIVGMGNDDDRPYVTFYDYLSRYNDKIDRLYLKPLMILESDDLAYRMIEMRRSYPR